MAAAFPQLLSHCAEGWKGSQVPYVVAEGIEALGTIYAHVHVRTTPSAPKVLASFAALVAGGIKRAASQIHVFCAAVGREGWRHTPHV
jgi:hypothetical protein